MVSDSRAVKPMPRDREKDWCEVPDRAMIFPGLLPGISFSLQRSTAPKPSRMTFSYLIMPVLYSLVFPWSTPGPISLAYTLIDSSRNFGRTCGAQTPPGRPAYLMKQAWPPDACGVCDKSTLVFTITLRSSGTLSFVTC